MSNGKQYNVSQDVSDYNTLFSKLFDELSDKFGQPTNYDKDLIKSDSKKLYPAKPQITLYERVAEWNKNSIYIKLRLNVTWRKSITLTRYWD